MDKMYMYVNVLWLGMELEVFSDTDGSLIIAVNRSWASGRKSQTQQ